jgi:hypothetical protein
MATITRYDECLVERDEVLFPHTDMIDTEPFYKNFTSIENLLRHNQIQKRLNKDCLNQPNSSQTINGFIFNLIRIVEDIGYHPLSPFIHVSPNHSNNKALCNLVLNLGGAHGPLVPIRRSYFDREYFQRWYLEKYSRSASLNRCNRLIKKTTQKLDDNRSNSHTCLPINTFKQMDEKHFQNHVLQMYGFDDLETNSSISSRRSSIDELNSTPHLQMTPVQLETIDNSKPEQQISIQEYYPSKDMSSLMVNRSLSSSSSQQAIEDNDYVQFISDHPELYNDPNPEIITKPNPNQVTYKQNVSVRYLVPPTPPPPGPLIIRGRNYFLSRTSLFIFFHFLEIIPPHPPTPPPLIIKHQDPAPSTPPPLILREAPPTPPSSQRVTIEHNPPV